MFTLFNGYILNPLILVTLYYGLRRSEVLGLTRSAVDFENNTLKINHTVVNLTTTIAKGKTKNSSSKRKYKLPPETKDTLEKLIYEQEKKQDYIR